MYSVFLPRNNHNENDRLLLILCDGFLIPTVYMRAIKYRPMFISMLNTDTTIRGKLLQTECFIYRKIFAYRIV